MKKAKNKTTIVVVLVTLNRWNLMALALVMATCGITFANNKTDTMDYPIIGKRCPEFTLTSVHNQPGKQISLESLRGSHVILDFWGVGCKSCIASFPKNNELQKKFRNLKIILVGKEYKNVREVYESFRKKSNLELTSTYDSVLFAQFKISGVPRTLWIDSNGIVKAISNGSAITESNIESFLAGEDFFFNDMSFNTLSNRRTYDSEKPLAVDGNGMQNSNFQYRSLLSEWSEGDGGPYYTGRFSNFIHRGMPKYETLKLPLRLLYLSAYWGGYTPKSPDISRVPAIETKDSIKFSFHPKVWYNYSVMVPPEVATEKKLMQIMQSDLKNYFGYSVNIERRRVRRHFLIKTSTGKKSIITRGGQTLYQDTPLSLNFQNVDLGEVVKIFGHVLSLPEGLINATDLTDDLKVDIDINCRINFLDEVNAELQKIGLNIEERTVNMNVLVISDPEPEAESETSITSLK